MAADDDFWTSLGAKTAAPDAPPAHEDESFWSSLGSKEPAPPDNSVSGFGNSVLRGIHEATDVPARALASGADYVAGKLGYQTHYAQDATDAAKPFNEAYDANPDNHGLGPAVGRFAGNAAVTIPAALGAGNFVKAGAVGLSRLFPATTDLLSTATPLLSGAAQGSVAAGMTGDPIGPSAMIGGGLGVGGQVAGAGFNKLIGKAAPEVETAMTKYDLPLRAGQTTDNAFLRKVDQMRGQLPFSGRAAENAEQATAFNKAVGQTFGEDVPKITPEVMARAQDRIGGVMDKIESANAVKIDDSTVSRLASIESNAHSALEDGEFRVIKRQLDNLFGKVGADGTIPGTTYGDIVGHGSVLDSATKSANSNIANYAKQIKATLQDSLHSSLSAEDAAAYGEARLQYKNLMTVAPLVNKGAPGDISPLLLQGAANRTFKDGWRYGRGDLGELADLAQRFLRPPADSGTPIGNAVLGGFWQPLVTAGKIATGATLGKAAGMVTGANPLTGVSGVSGAIPTSIIARNKLLKQAD